MGQNTIERKLTELFATNPKLEEPVVVYILVGVRKLLELTGKQQDYPALVCFCNWGLHSKLDGKEALRLIKLFDEMEDTFDFQNPANKAFAEAHAKLNDTLGANALRTELKWLFSKLNIITGSFENDDRWSEVLHTYSALIHEAPLECNLTRIKHVAKVVVERIDKPSNIGPPAGLTKFLFRLRWTPIRFNGNTGMVQEIEFWD